MRYMSFLAVGLGMVVWLTATANAARPQPRREGPGDRARIDQLSRELADLQRQIDDLRHHEAAAPKREAEPWRRGEGRRDMVERGWRRGPMGGMREHQVGRGGMGPMRGMDQCPAPGGPCRNCPMGREGQMRGMRFGGGGCCPNCRMMRQNMGEMRPPLGEQFRERLRDRLGDFRQRMEQARERVRERARDGTGPMHGRMAPLTPGGQDIRGLMEKTEAGLERMREDKSLTPQQLRERMERFLRERQDELQKMTPARENAPSPRPQMRPMPHMGGPVEPMPRMERGQPRPEKRPEPRSQISAPTSAGKKDVMDTLAADEQFKVFVSLVRSAGLADELRQKGPLTVFAPTNAAFEKLPRAALQSLVRGENKQKAAAIVRSHIAVNAKVRTRDVGEKKTVAVQSGNSVKIESAGGKLAIGDANFVKPDIEAANGIIQGIDHVMIAGNRDGRQSEKPAERKPAERQRGNWGPI